MVQVKKYANKKGIYIKGDIPILISPDSCDAWLYPEIFDFNLSAGAPPDMYSSEGQNWGFPIYNWDELKKENYFWWRQRLKTAEEIYDLYRIDHIVGFFRIWAIPHGKSAKEGFFMPRDDASWIDHGKTILSMMLQACKMLPIGEDLGVIPPAVRVCMHEMGICGTKVIRWERYYNGDKSFIKFYNYPLDSMTTVSTHDSETVLVWWRNHPDEAHDFAQFMHWEYKPVITKEQRKELLWSSHRTNSLFHINLLQEYLTLLDEMSWPSQDEERINLPGVVSNRNWAYRFKPALEEMIQSEKLKEIMVDIIP
jgi:4-alpha-glucanotransferase